MFLIPAGHGKNLIVVDKVTYRAGSADWRGRYSTAPGVAAWGANVPLVEVVLGGQRAGRGGAVRRSRGTASVALNKNDRLFV